MYYFYGVYSKDFELFDNVEFIEGLPNDCLSLAIPNAHVLIIINDLQQEANKLKPFYEGCSS